MPLRDYQDFAVESIFKYFETHSGNPIVAMPTGTGKSHVISDFIRRVVMGFPNQKIVMLTHVKELIEQDLAKLLEAWPTAPVGVLSAGLDRYDTRQPIIFAGIGTAIKRVHLLGYIDLILIDECHLVSPEQETMYKRFIKLARQENPNLKVIGFTATHFRMGQGMLTDDGGLFTDTCVDMTGIKAFNWFIEEGYLVRLVPRPMKTQIDISSVRITGGEYNLKDLQKATDIEEITYAALQETMEFGKDRNKWLIFGTGIDHVVHIAEMLDSFGISVTYVHSKMESSQRDANIEAYKAGRYQVMVNNGILTTGFDDIEIDLIVILRYTMSSVLWVQILGRGIRPWYAPGFDLNTRDGRLAAIYNSPKRNCLVLDFPGNTKRLGPINDPIIPKKRGKKGGPAPIRICENCGIYCHASLAACPECGFIFPRITRLHTSASTAVLIAETKEEEKPIIEDFKVDKVVYKESRKEGKPPTLKVQYYCGLRRFEDWQCFEHKGRPANKANEWWRLHTEYSTPPETVFEAIQRLDEIKTPQLIKVWINKKYPEVLNYAF